LDSLRNPMTEQIMVAKPLPSKVRLPPERQLQFDDSDGPMLSEHMKHSSDLNEHKGHRDIFRVARLTPRLKPGECGSQEVHCCCGPSSLPSLPFLGSQGVQFVGTRQHRPGHKSGHLCLEGYASDDLAVGRFLPQLQQPYAVTVGADLRAFAMLVAPHHARRFQAE